MQTAILEAPVQQASGGGSGTSTSFLHPQDETQAPRRGDPRRWEAFLVAGLVSADALSIIAALLLSKLTGLGLLPEDHRFDPALVLTPVMWVLVFHAFGLHTLHLPPSEELLRAVGASSVGVVLTTSMTFWRPSFSRNWIVVTCLFALGFELIGRAVCRRLAASVKEAGRFGYRTVIVGSWEDAARLAQRLQSPGSGFLPVGYVDVSDMVGGESDLPLLGHINDMPEVLARSRVECVFVAPSGNVPQLLLNVARAARLTGAKVHIATNCAEFLASRLSLVPVGGLMTLSVTCVRLSPARAVVKRAFDLCVGTVGLVVSLPLMVSIALGIRLTSKGPVLFRQERVTKGGQKFTMYKFRTMTETRNAACAEVDGDSTTPFFKVQCDPRVTKLGKLLRSLSFDELPQLLNVLRGDMSLVGPRPLPVEQVVAHEEFLSPRHDVRAGLTGWWQINGRSNLAGADALRQDLFYIENWSLALDLYILLKTLPVALSRRGAY